MNVLGRNHQVGAPVGEAWGAGMGAPTDYLAPVATFFAQAGHFLFKLHACIFNGFADNLPGKKLGVWVARSPKDFGRRRLVKQTLFSTYSI